MIFSMPCNISSPNHIIAIVKIAIVAPIVMETRRTTALATVNRNIQPTITVHSPSQKNSSGCKTAANRFVSRSNITAFSRDKMAGCECLWFTYLDHSAAFRTEACPHARSITDSEVWYDFC